MISMLSLNYGYEIISLLLFLIFICLNLLNLEGFVCVVSERSTYEVVNL
jgi:hypothetical protein